MSHVRHHNLCVQSAAVCGEPNRSLPNERVVSGARRAQDHLLVAAKSNPAAETNHIHSGRGGHIVSNERAHHIQVLSGVRLENSARLRTSSTSARRGEDRHVLALHGFVRDSREPLVLAKLRRGALLQSAPHAIRSDPNKRDTQVQQQDLRVCESRQSALDVRIRLHSPARLGSETIQQPTKTHQLHHVGSLRIGQGRSLEFFQSKIVLYI